MKKAFYISFCFYFISLALLPCEEKGNGDDCCETEMAQHSSDDDKSDEACSPFCVGSCCTPHLLVKDFQTTLSKVAVVNTIYTQHTISELSEIALPIWQPPKLA